MIKVLHLLQSNRFSGAENVVFQIISLFPDANMVYCSRDGQIRGVLEEKKIEFAPIRELTVAEVKRVIKEQQPDIIHTHDMRAGFIATRACGKTPLISHIHNNNFDSRGISPKSFAYMLAGMKAKHIFWVSDSSYNGYYFHNLFRKKSSVLYNVIDADLLKEKMRSDTTDYNYDAVYVGRLTFQKDPERLIRVIGGAVKLKPDFRAAVVGTGDLEDTARNYCHSMGLDDNIDFLGFCENPLKILHDAKAMLMTSRWEGTPMCALEAMALGVPIVSTPTDGLKYVVDDGKTGFLSDDDNTLASKLVSIAANEDERINLADNTVNRFKEINDIQKYHNEINEVYRKYSAKM